MAGTASGLRVDRETEINQFLSALSGRSHGFGSVGDANKTKDFYELVSFFFMIQLDPLRRARSPIHATAYATSEFHPGSRRPARTLS